MKRRTLQEFIKAGPHFRTPRSEYLDAGKLTAYVRAGRYHFDRQAEGPTYLLAFGISNVSLNLRDQGKGIFRDFIVEAERLAKELGYAVIRVEEVMNPSLFAWLHTHGYQLYRKDCATPTLFKYLQE